MSYEEEDTCLQRKAALADGKPPHQPFLPQELPVDRVAAVGHDQCYPASARVRRHLVCKVLHVLAGVNVARVIDAVRGREVEVRRGAVEPAESRDHHAV